MSMLNLYCQFLSQPIILPTYVYIKDDEKVHRGWENTNFPRRLTHKIISAESCIFTESRAEPGHSVQVTRIHVFSALRPFPQDGVRGTRSSGPHDHSLLPHRKASRIAADLLRDRVFQVTTGTFLENLGIPGLLTHLSWESPTNRTPTAEWSSW